MPDNHAVSLLSDVLLVLFLPWLRRVEGHIDARNLEMSDFHQPTHSKPVRPRPGAEYLTVQEVALLLGASLPTVRWLTKQEKLMRARTRSSGVDGARR